MDLSNLRKDYQQDQLRRDGLAAEPMTQFELWFAQAQESERVYEANAMTLATVDDSLLPLQRTVLLKAFDSRGFVFYTNYTSRKARQVESNPQVSLLFPWVELERQVIVRGSIEKVSSEETAAYFATRPCESQLGAWVSEQSAEIANREVLQTELDALAQRFEGQEIPVPDFWGGYRIVPQTIEFWQGGAGRLHDRFEYRREGDSWSVVRLSP